MFSTKQLKISKSTWIKCLLETNLASSVKPSNAVMKLKKDGILIFDLFLN